MRVKRYLSVALFPLAVVGCGNSTEGGAAKPGDAVSATVPADGKDLTGQAEVTNLVRDNTYTPQHFIIDVGTTVTFDNKGRTEHNVLPAKDGDFEPIQVADLGPGESAAITFDTPGEFVYYCSLHGTTSRGMWGSVVVKG